MKLFFHTILSASVALAFCTACSSEPGNPPKGGDSVSQADGGSNDKTSVDGDEVSKNDTIATQIDSTVEEIDVVNAYYITLKAKTPDGKPATFYVCISICEGYNEATGAFEKNVIHKSEGNELSFSAVMTYNRQFDVRIIKNNYLFAQWNTKVEDAMMSAKKDTSVSHEWTEIGSWGYSMNKTNCLDSLDGKKKNVATSVKNGKVTLKVGTSDFEALVTDHSIVATDATKADGFDLTGTINADGSVITYHWTNAGGSGDATLTCQ